MIIRAATVSDAEALLDIYAPYVLKTAITFEYDVPSLSEFTARVAQTLEKYPYLAIEDDGSVLGYAYASPFHARPAYGWSAESAIYLRGDARGRGLGKALYLSLEKALTAQGILNLCACVACTDNEDAYLSNASVRFHEQAGFRPVGAFRKCGYKFGRWYDMIWLEKHLAPHPDAPAQVILFRDIPGDIYSLV